MGDYNVINYSNIFLSCIMKKETKCVFDVKDHTLIYVDAGECIVDDRGEKTRIGAGECAFIRRNNGVTMDKRCINDGEPYLSIALSFPRKFLMEVWRGMDKSRLPDKAQRTKTNFMKIPTRPDIRSLFESIKPFFDTTAEPDGQWIRMKLTEGLYAVLCTDENLYASLFDFAEPWKIDILDYLNENYMYELSMQEIATYTGRSLATFKRDFKKISDLTPRKWIIRRRLERAHELLTTREDGNMPRRSVPSRSKIRDIMTDVGFTNESYFSRIFKETYGYSPTETRAS